MGLYYFSFRSDREQKATIHSSNFNGLDYYTELLFRVWGCLSTNWMFSPNDSMLVETEEFKQNQKSY